MKIKNMYWPAAIFLVLYQGALLLTLPFYFIYYTPSLGLIGISTLFFILSGLSITGGYHRCFSHKSYKAHPVVEWFLLFFGAMAAQGSALRWSYDHRLHHAHVDTDLDPYTIRKGFWYAHFLWLFEKPKEIEPKIVSDLLKNPRIMHQHRYIGLWIVGTNALAFLLAGFLLKDYIGAFMIALWLRLFCLHHFTWFINSVAHTFGDRPFCQEQTAVNNYILSFFTFGEGYHNYHHVYANDYRNGIAWFHFDPTKWLIWCLNKIGLAYDLKQMDLVTVKKKMVMERKQLLLSRLAHLWYVKKEDLEFKVHEITERLLYELNELKALKSRWQKLKAEKKNDPLLQQLQEEMSKIKANLQSDWKRWKLLSKGILRLQPFQIT